MFSRKVSRVLLRSGLRPAVPLTSMRFTSSTSSSSPSSSSTKGKSAVNVEDFTLNEDVVRAHMEAAARWQELGERLEARRAAADYTGVIAEAQAGLKLLEELGPEDSPIQCEANLQLEAAQAHYNLAQWTEAQRCVDTAMKILTQGKVRDEAQIAKVKEFAAFTTLKRGDVAGAETQFRAVLQWIDVDSRSAMPMVTVAAANMRRTVKLGLGMTLEAKAAKLEDTSEAKQLFGNALDVLIESLDAHIEENDVVSVKQTLDVALRCFVGLNDGEQAITTCRKYVNWCVKHDDAAGEAHGRAEMERLCARFNKTNPLPPPAPPKAAEEPEKKAE